ncbi:winged helix-turn-helix domain-containing protein [Streptomyces sp. NPDC047000]|uniref:GntR family transcriptional regulator n=1 Tax=Streptomyces sp. NPDC047000 TaxID=3155474 RepID=UPI0034053B48
MALKTDDPRPPYVQVADELRREIQAGRYKPGQKLPSLRELSERFDIAPMTATNALRALREDGLVMGVPGRGTFVRAESASNPTVSDTDQVAQLADRVQTLETTVSDLIERLAHLEGQRPADGAED